MKIELPTIIMLYIINGELFEAAGVAKVRKPSYETLCQLKAITDRINLDAVYMEEWIEYADMVEEQAERRDNGETGS